MPTVGEQLRAAREARKLTVHQVAEFTKLRADHVRAIEDGNFSVFAAPVYIRGFIRTYATLLKLDVPAVMGALDAELSGDRNAPAAGTPAAGSDHFLDFLMLQLSRVNWRAAVVIAGTAVFASVAIFGYRSWRAQQSVDPLSNLGPGLYQPAQPDPGDTLPLPSPAPARP